MLQISSIFKILLENKKFLQSQKTLKKQMDHQDIFLDDIFNSDLIPQQAEIISNPENYPENVRHSDQSKLVEAQFIDFSQVSKRASPRIGCNKQKTKPIKKQSQKPKKVKKNNNKHQAKSGRPKNTAYQRQFMRQLNKIKYALFYEVETSLKFEELIENSSKLGLTAKPQVRGVLQNALNYQQEDNFPDYQSNDEEKLNIEDCYFQTSMLGLLKNYKDTFLKSRNLNRINYEHLILLFKIFLKSHNHWNSKSNDFIENNQEYILDLLKYSNRVIKAFNEDNFEKPKPVEIVYQNKKEVIGQIQRMDKVQREDNFNMFEQKDESFYANGIYEYELPNYFIDQVQRQQSDLFYHQQVVEQISQQNQKNQRLEPEKVPEQQEILEVYRNFSLSRQNQLANIIGNYFYYLLEALDLKVSSHEKLKN